MTGRRRPASVEWHGDPDAIKGFEHGAPLLVDGRLQAATRDATFLSRPDVRTIKATHVMVASREIAIGSGESGVAAACDPRHIMVLDAEYRDAADTHPNGRCARPGCLQLFRQADHDARTGKDPRP